jgi:hypothetical protein
VRLGRAQILHGDGKLVLMDVADAENAGARNGPSYFRESPWTGSAIFATLST